MRHDLIMILSEVFETHRQTTDEAFPYPVAICDDGSVLLGRSRLTGEEAAALASECKAFHLALSGTAFRAKRLAELYLE